MAQTDRLNKINSWLKDGKYLKREFLTRTLGVSASTIKRDIAFMRDSMNVPVSWDPHRGYFLDQSQPGVGPQWELPGLWFSAEEVYALITVQHLLANLDTGGLLKPHVEPLMKRLSALLGAGVPAEADLMRRIRVLPQGARKLQLPHFQLAAGALLQRQRLVIHYRGRSRGDVTEREISPQRLVHYRDNWYLDAWCHWRGALRSFSVDAIEKAQVLVDRAALDIDDDNLDAVLGAGYGIFAGSTVKTAGLRFSVERSRWVSCETWHPLQRGRFDSEGRWLLDLPYADPRELVMDILRHVPEVEVLWPEELQEEVRARLAAGLRVFDAG